MHLSFQGLWWGERGEYNKLLSYSNLSSMTWTDNLSRDDFSRASRVSLEGLCPIQDSALELHSPCKA